MEMSTNSAPCSPSFWACSSLRRWQMFGLTVCLLIASVTQAGTSLFQVSFEKGHGDWTVIRGTATPDSRILHGKETSLRIQPDAASQDACVRLTSVALTLGKRYELSGWVRTEALQVHDLGRSPIASGAALTMASMPFDVHSGIDRWHTAVDALDPPIHRQPSAGRDTAHSRQRRHIEWQGLVRGHTPECNLLRERVASSGGR